jgi:hypothetical protein
MRLSGARLIQFVATIVVGLMTSLTYPMSSKSQNADLQQNRRAASFQFTASRDVISLPVAVADDETGLLIVERRSGRQRLLSEPNMIFSSPHLSADGKHLIFVRRRASNETRELLSCVILSWKCRILLRTPNTIMSPLEIDQNTILFSSSPLLEGPDKRLRATQYDLYMLRGAPEPRRLTDLKLYQLDPISLAGNLIIFSAIAPSGNYAIIPKRDPVTKSSSDIFELELNLTESRIKSPSQPLAPLFSIGGYSTFPSTSTDGAYVAFLNRRASAGQSRYNLVIATHAGAVMRYIEASGTNFSRAAFVGETVLASELFEDRYVVREFEMRGEVSRVVLELNHSLRSLRGLERMSVQVDD